MDQLRRSVVLLALGLLAACARPAAVSLEHSFESPESLAQAVLVSLAEGREHALVRYALTEHELRMSVWPHLPASRPEVGMDWNYFWRDHTQRNRGHLMRTLQAHRGKSYQLDAVTFASRARYGAATIHREAVLSVRTPAGSERIRFFGSMVELGGRWKLYSFVVD